MLLIGLTGGIGSGKSTVSDLLARRGAVIIDADAITRELQKSGQPVYNAIVDRFGSSVVGPDGELDRRALAGVVFNDDSALSDINAMVHPAVGVEMHNRIEAEMQTANVVILDIPLLVEALGAGESAGGRMTPWGHMAGLIVVDVDPEIAVERLVEQRGFTEDDVRARMANQTSREARRAMADFIVPNGDGLDELVNCVNRCWDWIISLKP